ncbi:nucleotidyltransferase family protein [Candidatus Methylospira mobilis]|nr:nucleotidyltransferase family protein [Candidatus Methylospira mobilis]WNV05352.1 nucleotidyltransferase family protein [Candidatus Methylospira mobilis]
MEAIVLAGGLGTRLRQTVPDLPKPMAPIAGRPFLEILLSMLAGKRFARVVISLGYMSEKIISHFGASYRGMELVYEIDPLPLGTGGAIRAALARCTADHAFVFNGDTYIDLDTEALERYWQIKKNPLIVVRKVKETARFGCVELRDGRVTAFLEKGRDGCGLINAGCYVLPTDALDEFPMGKPFSIESDYFVRNAQSIRFDGFVYSGRFIDIGVPDDYALAQSELAGL